MDNDAIGRDLLSKAEKKLKSLSLFGNKYDEAAELLAQAANNFKIAKAWQDAATTYIKLAEVQVKLESKHEVATAWVDAANCYRKVNPREATRCLQQAVQIYMQLGRLGIAAKHLRDTAEVLEKDGDKQGALELYEKAADLYDGESSSTTESNKCKLKIAQFAAEVEDYAKAVKLYEDIAKVALDNNLLKFGAKGHLLNAYLCLLNLEEDVEALKDRLERYRDWDIAFSGSREDDLLSHIIESIEEADADKFAEAVQEYDSISRLDAWRTQMLLRAKRRIQAGAFGGDDDLT